MPYQKPEFKKQYENYIGGQWTAPVDGEYFEDISPVDGSVIAKEEKLALVETWGNGKAIRETVAADIPLTVDHFRYFGGVIRAEAGDVADFDAK